jgi:hypothetical protein
MPSFAIRVEMRGNSAAFAKAQAEALPKAHTAVIRRRTFQLRNTLRRQLARAGLGGRLEKAIRATITPANTFSVKTIGEVASKALIKRYGNTYDLVRVFEKGATITGRGGKPLYITGKTRSNTAVRTSARFGPNPRNQQGIRRVKQVVLKARSQIKPEAAAARALRGIGEALAREHEKLAVQAAKKFTR